MLISFSPVRFTPLSVDADGDTIPDAPAAPAGPAVSVGTGVITGTVQAGESSLWDDLTDWAAETWDDITGTTADTSESTSVPAAASGCGLFVGATAPDERDAGTDIDADGDTMPDQPDVEVPDDTPDVPDDTPDIPDETPEIPDADADADDVDVPEDIPDVPDDGDVPEDGPVCTPIIPVIFFTAPTNAEGFTLPDETYAPSGVVQSGTILARPGITCYHADVASGIYPNGAVPPWTPNPSPHPVGATVLRADPDTSEDALEENSTTFDGVLSWQRDTISFNNSLTWCLQARSRIISSRGEGQASALAVADGTKAVQFGILADRVQDADNPSGFSYTVDNTVRSNTFLFCGTGSSYWLYVNEDIYQGRITRNGPSLLTLPAGGQNLFMWGDLSPSPGYDAQAFYNHICYVRDYRGFNSSGSVILRYDLGTPLNNLGSGARALVDGVFPASTGITIENTRSGDTTDPSTGTWSALQPLSGDNIQSPPNRYLELVINLTTGDSNVSPLFRGVQFLNLCGY